MICGTTDRGEAKDVKSARGIARVILHVFHDQWDWQLGWWNLSDQGELISQIPQSILNILHRMRMRKCREVSESL